LPFQKLQGSNSLKILRVIDNFQKKGEKIPLIFHGGVAGELPPPALRAGGGRKVKNIRPKNWTVLCINLCKTLCEKRRTFCR
jgi:hypothetical protein